MKTIKNSYMSIAKTEMAIILLFVIMLFSCNVDPDEPGEKEEEENINPSGKVMSSSQGIGGVVVTDGNNFTITDANGNYSLPYNASATHVYISSPSGYVVPVVNSVPQFYVKLTSTVDRENVNFTLNKMIVSDLKHYFIAVGDPQVRNQAELGKYKLILDYMKSDISANNLTPVHLMVTGDIVFDTPDMHNMSKSYHSSVGQPVYYAIGNHDHTKNTSQPASDAYDKTASSVYINHYGPTYYSFNRGQAHYIVLDNIFYKGGPKTEYSPDITQEQLDWVRKDLAYVSKDKILIVMAHSPTKSRFLSAYGNSRELHSLLSGYKDVQIISGHTHYNSVLADGSGITEHIIGAACGGWWEGPVCVCGTYLGYKIFEVDGTNVKWKYKAYEYPDRQFTVFKPGERAAALRPSEELLVNVWDWDAGWEVSWSEDNGVTFNSLTRCISREYDPIAYEFFGVDGDNTIPVGRTWIDANTTDHIFSCIPSSEAEKVIVKVKNRFGEELIEEVVL